MTLDADVIVDRRRLRRKLTFWRVVAVLAVVVAAAVATALATGVAVPAKRQPHIARIEISGLITDRRERLQLIDTLAATAAVKGVIVAINSPGGSTTGGEGIVEALRKLGEKKPVVAHIGTVGASAGYMIAIAADHVVSRRNAITGSIGVLFQFGNAGKLLETIGVQMEAVKSSPLKAEPDFYSPATEEARAMLQSVVRDSYDWFVDFVAERRPFDIAEARALADGRVFTGHQALQAKLVDEVGGEEAAKRWLVETKGLGDDLPVVDWKEEDGFKALSLARIAAGFAGNGVAEILFGADSLSRLLLPDALVLDGLVSVWHAPSVATGENSGGS